MIFVDRSVPRSVAEALQCVGKDVEWFEPRYPSDTPDEQWLADAGSNNWLVIVRDKKIRTRPAERQAVRDHQVGCFVIVVKKSLNRWEYLRLIVCHLDEMEEIFDQTARPFIWTVESRGLGRRVL